MIFYRILLQILWLFLLVKVAYDRLFHRPSANKWRLYWSSFNDEEHRAIEGRDRLWIHASSVGEIVAASSIVRALHEEKPERAIVLSVFTENGYAMAKKIVPEADLITYFPLDHPCLLRRAFKRLRPKALLIVETELWPNFLRVAQSFSVPIIMVNGRLSQRSTERFQRFGFLAQPMLRAFDRFCMQGKVDVDRLRSLAVPADKIVLTGNTKFDQSYGTISETERQELRCELGLTRGFVLVAGSTHEGEEAAALKVLAALPEEAQLLLAPRHMKRLDEVLSVVKDSGFSYVRRSETIKGQDLGSEPKVLILDTIGELGRMYSLADLVFVGGSIAPIGGHNMLEPAAHGKAIVVGPHMEHFTEALALLKNRRACAQVAGVDELVAFCKRLYDERKEAIAMGEAALAVVEENKGATARTMAALQEFI